MVHTSFIIPDICLYTVGHNITCGIFTVLTSWLKC